MAHRDCPPLLPPSSRRALTGPMGVGGHVEFRTKGALAVDHPREFILRDVRCFEGEQRGRLRPITLLVGENSTGKTTFLGCYGVLHRVFSGRGFDPVPDFNGEPFTMGSFRDIVRARLGPRGRIGEFKLGLGIDAPDSGLPPYEWTVTFRENGSQPEVASLHFQFKTESASELFLELQRSGDGTTVRIPGQVSVPTDTHFDEAHFLTGLLAISAKDRGHDLLRNKNMEPVIAFLADVFALGKGVEKGRGRSKRGAANDRHRLMHGSFGDIEMFGLRELIPLAPLRSKPKRTYDPVREAASPEGAHIPMLMMRLDRTDKRHWDSLHDELAAFGRESGLFSDIRVKSHGKQMSDPFQLQVKVRSGPRANIMDVGYGVSQSLPTLVDIMAEGPARGRRRNGGDERTFLLQQPEVHLHPRGQAQLANLFIEAYRKRSSRFLIETHSDYIVDRVRISVRQGLLKPEDVSILYFEPNGRAAKIHSMSLDEHGNLLGAPPGYRDFFSKETDRLLGFAD